MSITRVLLDNCLFILRLGIMFQRGSENSRVGTRQTEGPHVLETSGASRTLSIDLPLRAMHTLSLQCVKHMLRILHVFLFILYDATVKKVLSYSGSKPPIVTHSSYQLRS